MKLFVFILGLVLASFTFAGEEHASGHDDSGVCSTDKEANCESHGDHKRSGKNKDWTHKRLEQVAEVLPQPMEDKSKSDKPDMVKLSAPKFLAIVNGTDVKLEWTKSDKAKVYHLQVSKDAGFNNRSMYVVNNNALTETSFQVTGLEPHTKYFWRVAAQNSDLKDSFTKANFTSSAFSTK